MSTQIVKTVAERAAGYVDLLAQEESAGAPSLSSSAVPGQNSLAISPGDIEFFNISPGLVAVEIKVTNDSDALSAPDILEIRAAPFGAFVPWQPLATIALPALAPREVRYVRRRGVVAQTAPLGSPDGLGPPKLLTAFGLADEPPEGSEVKAAANLQQAAAKASPPQQTGKMPPGLMDLLLQTTPHWAGNINVLVGGVDVERHRAQALRVYPGRLNMAWFIVGAPAAADAYAFRLRGVRDDWEARLFDMTSRETLAINSGDDDVIAPGQWIDTQGSRTMLLALRVPPTCEAGTVCVHVIQQSTRREAVVEFSLDPRAAGRGCYSV